MSEDLFTLPKETQSKAWNTVFAALNRSKGLIIGLSVAIGSLGLLLGGLTVFLTYLILLSSSPEQPLIAVLPPMITGFFAVGLTGLIGGGLVARANIRKLRPKE